jgi:hypothetical protein
LAPGRQRFTLGGAISSGLSPRAQAAARTGSRRGPTLAGDTLSFSLPLSLLHEPDNTFCYGFQLFQYGAWTTFNYYAVSALACYCWW